MISRKRYKFMNWYKDNSHKHFSYKNREVIHCLYDYNKIEPEFDGESKDEIMEKIEESYQDLMSAGEPNWGQERWYVDMIKSGNAPEALRDMVIDYWADSGFWYSWSSIILKDELSKWTTDIPISYILKGWNKNDINDIRLKYSKDDLPSWKVWRALIDEVFIMKKNPPDWSHEWFEKFYKYNIGFDKENKNRYHFMTYRINQIIDKKN